MLSTRRIEIFHTRPAGFNPQVQVAACYVEAESKLLLLKIASGKKEAGSWGVPAGKLDAAETPEQGAVRELFEETGIRVTPSQLRHLGALFIRKPEVDYVYHCFGVELPRVSSVNLSPREHSAYRWVTPDEILDLPLMEGAQEALEHYQQVTNGPFPVRVRPAVRMELDWVNQRYDELGFIHSDFEKEIIAVAEVDAQRAGLGRLVTVTRDSLELGGIYVFEAFRGKGVAGRLVEYLMRRAKPEQDVYCIPFTKLITFYQRYGFEPCHDCSLVPETLKQKMEWCSQSYSDEITLLVRPRQVKLRKN